jgi:retron-type reverse transcriptase
MKVYNNLFDRIASLENLFAAWNAFKGNKRNKDDVQRFERHLEQNIFQLHRDLTNGSYRHGPYYGFYIHDPKQRHIHKASVRDRVLHHAVVSVINPVFEETFIPTSFSCRIGFGTHKGVDALEGKARAVGRNGTAPCFVLKCDVRKFFDSVNHDILLGILGKRIKDDAAMRLIREIVGSFSSSQSTLFERKGLPIGNLTSQLFANAYMNQFDQFVKHDLKVKHYARYTDDFVVASSDRAYLESLIGPISRFLNDRLALELHPKKVSIGKLHNGIDFLGYVIFPEHRLVRTKTRRRMFTKFAAKITASRGGTASGGSLAASLQSYLGVLSHANALQLADEIQNLTWFLP